MPSQDPVAASRLVVRALELSGQRGILHAGWNGLADADLPDNVLHVEYVPHDWLFPQMAGLVHHGGAGTTAAALRAGIPSLLIPFLGDQPFWGKHVHDLGVSARPIPRKKLSAERLAAAIQQITTNTAMHKRAAALGAKIRAEDGVANAVKIISESL